jgi:lysophospholipase L1-like esterase
MARGTHRPSIIAFRDYIDQDGPPSFPDLNLLAEGDSWFTISGFPAYNLLFELRFRKATQIVSCALPGDTIKHMAQIASNRSLRLAFGTPGKRWDVLLLSGGGNDLIDAADEILLPKGRRPADPQGPDDFCDMPVLRALVQDVQDGYRRIAALRDLPGAAGQGTPILTHTYDYATPRNAPAFARLGPWLQPALLLREVPPGDWVRVSDFLTDSLAEGILALSTGPAAISGLHVVNTRGTLRRADPADRGNSRDWQNEIHPNGGGYEKLAKLLEKTLDLLLL